jgi:DNA-binding transcriptional LysR family regulator
MEDLNDLLIFSQVVEHNGFTGAARALGVARSSICRRVGQLEGRLGVRLVQRSTRHFAVTEIGMDLHAHCVKMVAEARAGYDTVACARARPGGLIRISCPPSVAQILVGPLIPLFTEKNPDVRIAIEATNRKVDIEENFDLSIRVRQLPSEDSGMIMRSLGIVQQVFVASPAFLERHGSPGSPAEAARLPTLSYASLQGPHLWKLVDADDQELQIRHEPKLIADDMELVCQAAVQGLGIAQLPLSICVSEIREGLLEIVLPDWRAPLFEVQIVFPSRRGLLPAVRSFIDFLSANCVSRVAEWQMKRNERAAHRESGRFWSKRQVVEQRVVASAQTLETNREARVA